MKIRQFICAFLTVLFVSSGASPHGNEKHGGSTIEGSIQKVSTESFAMETEKGVVTVTLDERSEIRSERNEALDRAALKPGSHVMVSGHKLPGGGFAAVEVMVHADGNQSDRPR